jgi:hypothetical protein
MPTTVLNTFRLSFIIICKDILTYTYHHKTKQN